MPKLIDLTGKRFGRLIVIKLSGRNKHGHLRWLCLCSCKKEVVILGINLRRGDTQSCGCLNKEKIVQRSTKHGYAKRKEKCKTYSIWHDMIQRCTNPNNKRYKRYGGRGITVCAQWMKFINFLNDMGEAPKGHQIDRMNNNKGYFKANCKWSTPKQQQRNRNNNHPVTYNNRTQCVSAWAEEFNINPGTLLGRLNRNWSIKKALTIPVKTNG